MSETILITGGAGFIGSHLCEQQVAKGNRVICVDIFDTFYSPRVKRQNVAGLLRHEAFHLAECDIRDNASLDRAMDRLGLGAPDVIVHLAARAGVRPSIEEPALYSSVNVEGTVSMLEFARRNGVRRFVFGSSSSVYGNNETVPFSEDDPVDHPISPYAATKRAGELLCHTYTHLYRMSVICLRFFTVYGPRQRPDLAIHKFAHLLAAGRPIPLFGDGTTERDYTYIDDILQGIEASIAFTAANPGAFELVNLGESQTIELRRLAQLIADSLGVELRIEWLPLQPGDVRRTFARVDKARRLLGYEPRVPVEQGIPKFIEWFRASAAERESLAPIRA